MSSEKNILITKVPNFNFWKNNIININTYSNLFFQLNLLKSIIFFFFFNSFSNILLKKNIFLKNIYISQIWINSINNIILLSFNLYLQKKDKNNINLYDNYLRLKYFHSLIYNSTIV